MATKSLTFDIYGRDKTASKTLKGLGNDVDNVGDRFRKFGTIAAAGLAAAAVGAIKFGADSVKAYAEAEESQIRLEDAFKRFPRLADTNIESLRKLNEQLAKKTRFDDDAYASGQAVLAQFELTGQQVRDLTPLLADYASKTGKDLPTAAEDLGKALLGQGRALKDVGIDFQDTGTVAGNFAQLVEGLRGQVGGFAEESATTAAGKLDILNNKFGEVQEKVGEELMPVLESALDWMSTDGMTAIEDFTGVVSDLGASLATLKEQDWFSGLTEALGEGGSLDLVGGGFLQRVQADFAALPQSFANGWDQIATAFQNGWTQVTTWWDTGWSDFAGKLENGRTQINTWATNSVGGMTAPWANGWGQITGAFSNGWQQITGFSSNIGATIATFVSNAITTLATLPGRIGALFANAGSWLLTAGANIVTGLINGIKGMIEGAAQMAARLAQATVAAAKNALGIQSPSKVFAGIGEFVGEGYVKGIDRSLRDAQAAVTAMVAPPMSLSVAGGSVSAAGGGGAVTNIFNYTAQPMRDNDPMTTATIMGREFARRAAG